MWQCKSQSSTNWNSHNDWVSHENYPPVIAIMFVLLRWFSHENQPPVIAMFWCTRQAMTEIRFARIHTWRWVATCRKQTFAIRSSPATLTSEHHGSDWLWRFPEIGVAPSYHPFIDGMFHSKPSSYWGFPIYANPPIFAIEFHEVWHLKTALTHFASAQGTVRSLGIACAHLSFLPSAVTVTSPRPTCR